MVMVEPLNARGMLRVVTPEGVTSAMEAEARALAEAKEGSQELVMTQLASFIRTEWETMRNHRNSASGWNERLLEAQRVFNGQYDAAKLAQIKQFGGSDVYARVIAVKCRGASSLLRDVYLGTDRPWGLDPTPEPSLPDDVTEAVSQLVDAEVQQMGEMGVQADLNQIKDRTNELIDAAKRAAKKKARTEAKQAEERLDDFLTEGDFYKALAEFIVDLPLFPFACLKGPVVRVVPTVTWKDGQAVVENKARMFWNRVSPFDVYWTPGVSDIADAAMIEKLRFTRADLNQLIDLPGYRKEAIEEVLRDYGQGGLRDWIDPSDSQRAVNENREDPHTNRSGMIDCLEYHGSVQGVTLLDFGMTPEEIPDPLRDYYVQAWLIGRHVIKVQVNPNPRKRHPYYVTSFEKVPGTPVGNALPDILSDIQDVCNATLRALVNNLSIASGPQVVVDVERMAPGSDHQSLYPWKRWYVSNDPMANQGGGRVEPVYFFQPNSNAQELLGIYEKFTQIADELSAIPRYITGSDRMGGAGRTASGLAMLMGNASKILQTVAANIDRDVIQPCLQGLYDLVMLTDTSGQFRGDERIVVRGVDVAVQRETDRQRQMEFLQVTANPIDMQIIGPEGRAEVLRSVANELGMDGTEIVPPSEDIKARMAQAMQVAPMGPGTPPGAAPMPGSPGMQNGGGPGPMGGAPPAKGASGALGAADGAAMQGMAR